MNIPTVICYLTPLPPTPTATIRKCGLEREIELLRAFQDLGFDPMVDTQNKPTVEMCSKSANAIVYVYMKEEKKAKRSLSMNVFGIPVEALTDKRYCEPDGFNLDIAALQLYNEPLSKSERMSIGIHIVERMTGEEGNHSERIKGLYAKGVFASIPVMTCSTSHSAGTTIIRPDTAPKPDDFVDPEAKELVLKTD